MSQASSPETRAEQIYAAFVTFHENNPDIWRHFKFYADQARASGRENYSANAIFERIRWYVDIETKGEGDLKLNNNFRAYYARLYHVAVPDASEFFRNRKRTSENKDAYANDLQEFVGPVAENETALVTKLTNLLQSQK